MKMHVYTESGSVYTWDINARTIERDGDSFSIRATAWANVRNVKSPVAGKPWEFTGWPGEIRYGQHSPWAARGDDTILTSNVYAIVMEADGVMVEVANADKQSGEAVVIHVRDAA